MARSDYGADMRILEMMGYADAGTSIHVEESSSKAPIKDGAVSGGSSSSPIVMFDYANLPSSTDNISFNIHVTGGSVTFMGFKSNYAKVEGPGFEDNPAVSSTQVREDFEWVKEGSHEHLVSADVNGTTISKLDTDSNGGVYHVTLQDGDYATLVYSFNAAPVVQASASGN